MRRVSVSHGLVTCVLIQLFTSNKPLLHICTKKKLLNVAFNIAGAVKLVTFSYSCSMANALRPGTLALQKVKPQNKVGICTLAKKWAGGHLHFHIAFH